MFLEGFDTYISGYYPFFELLIRCFFDPIEAMLLLYVVTGLLFLGSKRFEFAFTGELWLLFSFKADP